MNNIIVRVKTDKVKPQKYRRLVFRFVPIAMMSFLLFSCGAFRVHDKGRSDVAQEAVKLSKELSSDSSAVFVPMEENFKSVLPIQEKLSKLKNKQAYESAKLVISNKSDYDIAELLVNTMNDRLDIIVSIEKDQGKISESINSELDRQAYLTKFFKDTNKENNFEETLKRVDNRLEWVEKIITNASKLSDRLKKDSKDEKNKKTGEDSLSNLLLTKLDEDIKDNTTGNTSESGKKGIDNEKIIQDLFSKSRDALKKIEKDERVDAATQLLQQVGLTTASIEQARLVEMKRYLGEIKRIKESIDNRDKISVQALFVPAIGHLLPVLNSKVNEEVNEKDEKNKIYKKLVDEKVQPLLERLKNSNRYADVLPDDFKGKKDTNEYRINCWKGNTLASYIVNDLKENEVSKADAPKSEVKEETDSNTVSDIKKDYIGKSPELIAGLGILVYFEREYFEHTQLLLAREKHKYSIRLSKENAKQRANIVDQLTQGLDIYYKGGIKPEEVAEIALLASQVGSLTFIGTQVH